MIRALGWYALSKIEYELLVWVTRSEMRAYPELVGCGCCCWVKGVVDEVIAMGGDSFDQSFGGRWMA